MLPTHHFSNLYKNRPSIKNLISCRALASEGSRTLLWHIFRGLARSEHRQRVMHQSIQFTTDETLTLAKAKACNLIGSWTESISSQGLEYFFPNVEIHSSYSQTLSSGPDFEANGIKIEAEHRASG